MMMMQAIFLFAVAGCSFLWGTVDAAAVIAGVSIDPRNPAGDATPSDLTAIGAKWVRMEFIDASTDSPSSASADALAFYQRKIGNFTSAGVRVLVILDYMTLQTVPWGGTAEQWAAYSTNFASRCASIASGLASVLMSPTYEIWNEEDLQQTHVPHASYAGLLRAVYTSVRTADSRSKIVMGGLASGNPQYVADVMASSGGGLFADQVGLHPYGQRPWPNWPSSSWGFGYMGDLVAAYTAVMPKHVPIFITEFGSNDPNSQGNFPYMLFSGIAAMPYNISAVVWYCWSDGQTGGFGLVSSSGSPKPDYNSYVNYTSHS